MEGVIGRRRLELVGMAFLDPLRTYSTRGMDGMLGLSMPEFLLQQVYYLNWVQ